MRRRFVELIIMLAVTVAASSLPSRASAEDAGVTEDVKAAFLYNFAKFVEWPDTAFAAAEAPLIFCIVGANPFGNSLDRIVTERTASGRRIEIRADIDPHKPQGCHLVYLPRSASRHVARIVHALGAMDHAPVLTVGESECFVDVGGMIRLVEEADRVRFDIDVGAAERADRKSVV